MRSTLPMVLAAAALSCTGCGTVVNTLVLCPEEGGQRIYGGVRVDLDVANPLKRDSGIVREAGAVPLTPADRVGRLAFLCIDLPLSIIGDTLTLPLILMCQASNQREVVHSFTSTPFPLDEFLSSRTSGQAWEPSGGRLPPPALGLDRFPELRLRPGSQ